MGGEVDFLVLDAQLTDEIHRERAAFRAAFASGMRTPRTFSGPMASTARCAVSVELIPPESPTTNPSRCSVFSVLRKWSVMMARIWVVSMVNALLRQTVCHLQEHRHAGEILLGQFLLGNGAVEGILQDFDQFEELQGIDFCGELLA